MLNCSVNQHVNTSVCYYTRSGRAHKTGRSSLCCFSILIGLSHYAAGTCAKPYHQFSKLPSWTPPAPPGPTTVPEITLITHVSVWFGMRFFCFFVLPQNLPISFSVCNSLCIPVWQPFWTLRRKEEHRDIIHWHFLLRSAESSLNPHSNTVPQNPPLIFIQEGKSCSCPLMVIGKWQNLSEYLKNTSFCVTVWTLGGQLPASVWFWIRQLHMSITVRTVHNVHITVHTVHLSVLYRQNLFFSVFPHF